MPIPDLSGWANDNYPVSLIVTALCAYLLGSIPFGVLITRAAGLGDVRTIGSGNIGATNVLRTGRKDLALATLVLDGGKGALAVLIATFLFLDLGRDDLFRCVAGGAAFLGHVFPVWLKFKGGKGVATFFGVLLAVSWQLGLLAGATWILVAALFRYSSLAALTAAVLAPMYAVLLSRAFMEPPLIWNVVPVMWLAIFMGVLILIRHRGNIARLRRGEEPRIGGRKA